MRSKPYPNPDIEFSGSVGSFLRSANTRPGESDDSVDDPMMRTLRSVSAAGVVMSEVVKTSRLSLQAVTTALRELEGSGLIRRIEVEGKLLFAATSDGEAILQDASPPPRG